VPDESLFSGAPLGQARVLYADPPWRFKAFSEKNASKMPQAHYQCMTIEAIRALPVASLADPRGCWLLMWCTSPMLDQQIEVLKAWGFTYKTQGQWEKLSKNGKLMMGTGHIFRSCSEPYIVGSIGKPKQNVKNWVNVLRARRREHSRKPDEMRENIERAWDGPYVELFGRQAWPGWCVLGNQVDKFAPAGEAPQFSFKQLSLPWG
jgi:N6-adenosine-specific RNA methylase IME4